MTKCVHIKFCVPLLGTNLGNLSGSQSRAPHVGAKLGHYASLTNYGTNLGSHHLGTNLGLPHLGAHLVCPLWEPIWGAPPGTPHP